MRSSCGIFRLLCWPTWIGILLSSPLAQADTDWFQNARTSVDVSARGIRSHGANWSSTAIGLDIHNVFSGERGDFGTLTFQPYLVRVDNAPMVGGLFDDEHDQELQWRIANFNYTGLGHGRFNIRLGHFELPFGLEQVVQTNGTLYQTNTAQATGLKTDWGVSINGELPRFEYELAYMVGSGNEFSRSSDGFLVGRVATPRANNWWVGLSAMDGELEGPVAVEERQRFGLDLGVKLRHGVQLLGEYALGTDDAQDVSSILGEVSTTTRNEYTFVYLQWRRTVTDELVGQQKNRRVKLGYLYEPSPRWSVSLEVFQDLDANTQPRGGALQFRYRT